jgi:HK97 family phage major capsid protein
MALKVLMTKKKIDSKRSELDALRAETNFETREADLEKSIDEAETDEERDAVEEEINKLEAEKAEKQEQIDALEAEIADLEAQLDELESQQETKEEPAEETKSEVRTDMSAEHGRNSMEYRTAFRDFVQTGKLNKDVLEFEKRNDATGTASDLGVLLPETVMQEIIKGVSEVHGQLYSRVRKTNLKGGVKYPIGSFSATFNRITETTVSYRQDAGGITGYVAFGYKIGEIRLARTLLQTVLSVPVFEQEFAKVVAEAYVKAMDIEIMSGTEANNQCVGILTEAAAQSSRIPSGNIIEFTAAEAADWKAWQKKLFAKIPLGMRAERPEFAMTAATYESVIKTLADNQSHPVYAETFNPVDGTEKATFKGKEVVFVENDSLKDFDTATNGQFFAMYWVPQKAYAINSNMEFTVVDYFDHETNQYVKKALVINDGKVLDGEYIYLLKKKVSA